MERGAGPLRHDTSRDSALDRRPRGTNEGARSTGQTACHAEGRRFESLQPLPFLAPCASACRDLALGVDDRRKAMTAGHAAPHPRCPPPSCDRSVAAPTVSRTSRGGRNAAWRLGDGRHARGSRSAGPCRVSRHGDPCAQGRSTSPACLRYSSAASPSTGSSWCSTPIPRRRRSSRSTTTLKTSASVRLACAT
jgi:hypothetical protein